MSKQTIDLARFRTLFDTLKKRLEIQGEATMQAMNGMEEFFEELDKMEEYQEHLKFVDKIKK